MRNEILEILNKFAQQEMGNRLSEFAMISLRAMIMDVIEKEQSKGKDGVSKENINTNVRRSEQA